MKDKIKFSAADWSFCGRSGLPPADYYAWLYKTGICGVEMVAPENMAAAREAGLEIINMSGPGMTEGLNRTENHAVLLPQIRAAIAQAQQAAIPALIIFSGNRGGQDDATGIANCITGIEQVLDDARQAGVTLLLEMLNVYDHPDYQAASSAYGLALARHFDSPHLKLLYDVYHMERMGENAAAVIPANLAQIAHLHVAESPRRSRPLAEGTINYATIVRAVHGAGYRGYWGMEYLAGADVLGELAQAVREFEGLI